MSSFERKEKDGEGGSAQKGTTRNDSQARFAGRADIHVFVCILLPPLSLSDAGFADDPTRIPEKEMVGRESI